MSEIATLSDGSPGAPWVEAARVPETQSDPGDEPTSTFRGLRKEENMRANLRNTLPLYDPRNPQSNIEVRGPGGAKTKAGATKPHTQVRTPAFLPGDIVFFASTGDLLSNVSRWLMRGAHEGPTYAVHTGQFVDPGRVLEMEGAVRIGTLQDLLNRRYWQGPFRALCPPPAWARLYQLLDRRFARYAGYWQGLWKARGFEVWRCARITPAQRSALTREALKYANVKFGFAKLGAHLLDDVICKLLHRNVFLFRHLDPADRHPVCSGITTAAYDRALHYRFGVDPECADPDQIHDWVRAHPEEWVRVFRFVPDAPAQAHRVLQAAGCGDRRARQRRNDNGC